MTFPQSKTDLVRMAWITELRRQGDRQCTGDYHLGTKVCALGLLAEVAGYQASNARTPADAVGICAGLNRDQSYEISGRNDGCHHDGEDFHKHTFAEIADVVEGWFR